MDFAKILGSYIRHLRRQSVHNQRIHAFSISGVITIIITVLWLHFYYGFWSSVDQEVYVDNQSYEVRELTDGSSSPTKVLGNFFDEAKRRMNEVSFDFSSIISDKETFERGE